MFFPNCIFIGRKTITFIKVCRKALKITIYVSTDILSVSFSVSSSFPRQSVFLRKFRYQAKFFLVHFYLSSFLIIDDDIVPYLLETIIGFNNTKFDTISMELNIFLSVISF